MAEAGEERIVPEAGSQDSHILVGLVMVWLILGKHILHSGSYCKLDWWSQMQLVFVLFPAQDQHQIPPRVPLVAGYTVENHTVVVDASSHGNALSRKIIWQRAKG